MSYYYNLPNKHLVDKAKILRIEDQDQLKYSCQEQNFPQVLVLNMKNSKVNDDSTFCLGFLEGDLNLESIDLSENFSFITDNTVEHLCGCKGLFNIKLLNLSDNEVTDVGIHMLANHANFHKLQRLCLYGNSGVTWVSLVTLAESEWVKRIRVLDLHATSIADKGLECFLLSQNSKHLQELDVSMNWERVGDTTLLALSRSEFCSGLQRLNVEDCSVSDVGVEQMSQSRNLESLESLNLSNSIPKSRNRISDRSLEAMAFSKTMNNLKTLLLKATEVTSIGIKFIVSSHLLQKLEVLKVSQCTGVTDQALYSIGAIYKYTCLRKLHVNSTSVTKVQAVKFQETYPKIVIVY